ncbi:MAG: hypothetical protein U9R16_04185 [Campylobacterota bacterium]|nr:hypothetical protein [Campylobacterota bacterium]
MEYPSTTTKNKTETTATNNTVLYILGGLLTVSVLFIAYTYLSNDMVKKGELKKSYIEKVNIEFDMLPSYIQDEYMKKYKCISKNDNIDKKPECEPKIVDKIVEKIVYKNINNKKDETKPSKNTIKLANNTKYQIYRCYDMVNDGANPSKDCISQLHNFLEINKNSSKFEIIGVVNKNSFPLFEKLKEYDYADEDVIDKVSKFSKMGLSRQRVIEGTWEIKNYLGVDTNTQVVNYTITSKKNNQGFVVRAYK